MVIIKDNAEIGSNNTIDRGSLGNTIIGENTFLDNQVHIAQQKIIKVVKKLEEDGTIVIAGAGGGDVV